MGMGSQSPRSGMRGSDDGFGSLIGDGSRRTSPAAAAAQPQLSPAAFPPPQQISTSSPFLLQPRGTASAQPQPLQQPSPVAFSSPQQLSSSSSPFSPQPMAATSPLPESPVLRPGRAPFTAQTPTIGPGVCGSHWNACCVIIYNGLCCRSTPANC